MKRYYIITIFILTLLLVSCQSDELEDINTALNPNDTIIYNDFELMIENYYINPLEIAKNNNEMILYIYITYPVDKTIYSNELYLNTLNKQKINYYSVDGLDYLGGINRTESPFIRFSVPNHLFEYILYIGENRIYLNVEVN